jgi:hypothetical protein
MSTQIDWVGSGEYPAPRGFVGPIRRKQRVQDEKQELREVLRPLVERIPKALGGCGVGATREWVARQKAALKVLSGERSSVNQLKAAISSMQVEVKPGQ